MLGILVTMMATAFFVDLPGVVEEATYSLPDIELSLDPSRVVRVEIDRTGAYVKLERIHGSWRITDPVNDAVDDDAIAQLLKGIAQFRLTNMVSTNPARQGKFQVDGSGTRVTITTEDGSSIPIVIGKQARDENRTFIRPASSNTVYLADGITPGMINRELRDWRHRTVYQTDPGRITAISLKEGAETFVFRKTGRAWQLDGGVVPREIMTAMLDGISNIQALDFVDAPRLVRNQSMMLVNVTGLHPISLEFLAHSASTEHVLLRTSASPVLFAVNKALVHRLQQAIDYFSVPPEPLGDIEGDPSVAPQEDRAATIAPQPQEGSIEDEGDLIVHSVMRGETLESIAHKYRINSHQIKEWNQLEDGAISAGMELYIFVRRR